MISTCTKRLNPFTFVITVNAKIKRRMPVKWFLLVRFYFSETNGGVIGGLQWWKRWKKSKSWLFPLGFGKNHLTRNVKPFKRDCGLHFYEECSLILEFNHRAWTSPIIMIKGKPCMGGLSRRRVGRGSKANNAGYTATSVACGWAGESLMWWQGE